MDETCPVCATAEIVCGKWTLLLVRDLSEGRSRFCELERSLAGISPRTLSLRLRALEEEGIVERHTYPEVPPRVEYIGAHAHGIEVRTRPRGGHWGPWLPLRAAGAHGPDNPKHDQSSDPVWVGDADELQLRGRRRALRLQFVAIPKAARRRHV